MRKIILTLIGAALIAGSASPAAFARVQHHGARFGATNAYASPYLASGTFGGTGASYGVGCPAGMYADNDANVYRDGQCREDYDVSPNGG